MGRLTRIFHRLHWKLTLTYTLVTVAAVVLLEIILLLFLGSFFVKSDYFPTIIAQALEYIATPELQEFIDQPAPDQQGLTQWLEQVWHQREIKMEESGWSLQFSPMVVNWLVVVDASGLILAHKPPHLFNSLHPLQDQLPLDQQPALLAV
ncbi:MAG: hypothetical protein IBX69_18315, partial [Anaerolineales bacterium]|nr:hypothetical protein [Anaerolineales bacterium]